MQAFLLAGGFATRLWPLTEKRAKPLLPLAGKPIITHLLENIPEGIPVT
ncbi:MAG: NDP-sugar synthase, partial [Patescibacteria group bacterium]